MAGEAGTYYKDPAVRNWARLLHIFMSFSGSIIISRLYKLTLTDQPQATLQPTVFDITQIFVTGPPLLDGPKIFFFTGTEPAVGNPIRPNRILRGL